MKQKLNLAILSYHSMSQLPMQGRRCFYYGCLMNMDYRVLKTLCVYPVGY